LTSKNNKAFTLLELMVVVVILGLLASLVVPNIIGKADEAKSKLTCVQMKSLAESLALFKTDNGAYPSSEEGLKALIKNPDIEKYKSYSNNGYLSSKEVPLDPWKNKYIYLGENSSIDIVSLGSDSKEGGDKDAADLKLSECK
jgi:general secretion pathway protein G